MFNNVIEKAIICLNQYFIECDKKSYEIDFLILAGGFSECRLLQSQINDLVSNK